MNLHFFGTPVAAPAHQELGESLEPVELAAHPTAMDSSDEGDEYVDDALRMVDQPFRQD